MNLQLRPADFPMTTQGAEGLARRCWTVAEIEAMVAAGIIDEDERFELIDGEVVPMSPKGIRHEMVKIALIEYWIERKSKNLRIAPETTFRLGSSSYVEPDFVFFDRAINLPDYSPKNALLAVEVSDSTLRYDMGRKAEIYARHGVALLWVIDVETLQTHVLSKPSADGFLERHVVEANEILAPHFAPEIAVKMAELPLI